MGVVEDHRRRRLVQFARFDAHQPVFHVVDAADAMLAAELVQPLISGTPSRCLPSSATGMPCSNSISRYSGSFGAFAGSTVQAKASAGGSSHGSSSTPASQLRPHWFWSML